MTIYEKLLEIKKAMPYLKKEHTNTGQGFMFVSSSQVLKIFREKCDELGVMVIPNIRNVSITTNIGKQILTELWIDYTIISIPNNEHDADEGPLSQSNSITISFYAQGMDVGEKGVGKALTYGEKYLILKLFNIPTDKDDPDASSFPTDPPKKTPPAAIAQPPHAEAQATKQFQAVMKALTDRVYKRDGNTASVQLLLDTNGFQSIDAVKASEDRRKIVSWLMKDLHITDIQELLGSNHG